MQPRFTAEEVTRFLFDFFAIKPDDNLVALPSYEDQNYKFKYHGAPLVAKISNSGITENELRLQNSVFDHLRTKGVKDIPAVLKSSNGDTLIPIPSAAGQQKHHLRVVEFVPGKVFASLPHHSDELYFSLGESLAHFQQALVDLPREGTDRGDTHHWDMRNALGMRKYLPDIEDASRRAIAENCFKEFEALVLPEYHQLRLGIIHCDANDHNILTNDEGTAVKCLIDYGDVCWSHLVNDVAICIVYAIIHSKEPFRCAQMVLNGYNSVMPLTEIETQKLPTLIKGRLAVSVCMSAHLYKENKDPYILVSEKFAWETLHILGHLPPEHILEKMRSSNAYNRAK